MITMAFDETTAGSGRLADLDVNVPVSAFLFESTDRTPFELFFASTGAMPDTVYDPALVYGTLKTPFLSEQPSRKSYGWFWRLSQTTMQEDQIAKVNSERVVLLARKYVAKESLSDEEGARLAIVTERVRKLLPAVSAREYETIEDALKLIQEARESDEELRKRTGITRRKNG